MLGLAISISVFRSEGHRPEIGSVEGRNPLLTIIALDCKGIFFTVRADIFQNLDVVVLVRLINRLSFAAGSVKGEAVLYNECSRACLVKVDS